MCETGDEKAALRGRFLRLRAEAGSAGADAAIAEHFLRSSYAQAESFFIYVAVRGEAATEGIIGALRALSKRVCLPRIRGKDMLAAPFGPLVRGAYGIPAPQEGEDTACDVAVVPLLAFDGRGTRLGYGGGWYDRYFASHPHMLRVGIAYEAQYTSVLPRGPWDIPLHAAITERGVRIFSNA